MRRSLSKNQRVCSMPTTKTVLTPSQTTDDIGQWHWQC
jgi:hypothetical protein